MAAHPADPPSDGARGVVRRLLREPLLHFLALASLLFAAYALVSPPPPPPEDRIVVTAQDADRLKAQFRGTWNRFPSPKEFRDLVDNFVREEIYYREARSYGLDLNDQVIRVRLRQKMEFLLANPAAIPAPTEAELRALFEATQAKYAVPATIAFRQVLLGHPSPDELEAARKALIGGADPATLGLPSLLPAEMPLSQPGTVDGTFGAGFFAQLAAVPSGEWVGPVRSSFGDHLVSVTAATQTEVPRFEDVRSAVEADWRRNETRKAAEAAYEALKARYHVDISQIDPPK